VLALHRPYRGNALLAGAAASAVVAAVLCEEAPAVVQTESCTLSDGRQLAFRSLGDPDGVVVFTFHGMGSSHMTWLTKSPLSELVPGVRVIALDRPGYGNSSPPPAGYSYAQWVDDLAALADHLGVARFCVAGHSSGGPYALAAAAKLPDRVLACAAISSDPPYNHPHVPEFVRTSDSMSLEGKGGFYGVDPTVKVAGWRASSLKTGNATKVHAWKQGELGFVADFTLERLPWSFKIEDINLGPRCTFWYGSADYDSMKFGSPWMQSLVPGSQLRAVAGGDHGFKSDPDHLRSILQELRDQARAAMS